MVDDDYVGVNASKPFRARNLPSASFVFCCAFELRHCVTSRVASLVSFHARCPICSRLSESPKELWKKPKLKKLIQHCTKSFPRKWLTAAQSSSIGFRTPWFSRAFRSSGVHAAGCLSWAFAGGHEWRTESIWCFCFSFRMSNDSRETPQSCTTHFGISEPHMHSGWARWHPAALRFHSGTSRWGFAPEDMACFFGSQMCFFARPSDVHGATTPFFQTEGALPSGHWQASVPNSSKYM